MEPRMIKRGVTDKGSLLKTCSICGAPKGIDDFLPAKGILYPDGRIPVCHSCLRADFVNAGWDWDKVDKFFQAIDVPFIPIEFERLQGINGDDVLPVYVKMFAQGEYESLDWKMYHEKYLEIKRKGQLDMEIPSVRESYFEDLKVRWGYSYDNEALSYLENLYNALLTSQNINGGLQTDQAQKLCKISWEIDERIRGGIDFDKMMASYEKLTKIADLTPKNVKHSSDLDSTGEIVVWLEKRKWLNPHYDGVNRDIVDELIKSTQTFAQRLYINENGAGEEVNERIEQLKIASKLADEDEKLGRARVESPENFFKLDEGEHDLEGYENDTYNELMVEGVLDNDTTRV